MGILIVLHLLAAVLWVGGMFFAYVALRPASGEVLQPPERLRLWHAVLRRFFAWVWVSVVTLLVTGYALVVLYGGMGNVGLHVHLMQGIGIVMMLLFAHLYFAPYRRLGRHVDAGEFPAAAGNLDSIRRIVATNLVLGVVVVGVGAGGRFFL